MKITKGNIYNGMCPKCKILFTYTPTTTYDTKDSLIRQSQKKVKCRCGYNITGKQLYQILIHERVKSPVLEEMIVKIAEYDFRLTLEADIDLQLDGIIADLIISMGGTD